MSSPPKIQCYGGPLDGKEIYYIEESIMKARAQGSEIPICEGDLEGMYVVPQDEPLRLVFVGPL